MRETGTTAFARRDEVCEAFARDGEAWGWGGSPRPGDPCRGASLSAGSLQPPGEVQGGRLTSPLRGRGLQGPSFGARDGPWETRRGWGRGAGPRRCPPGACSAPAPRGRAQPVGRSLGGQFLHLPATRIEGTSSLASCACSNVCALPGIAGERGLGVDVSHHLRIATGHPDSHRSDTGICARRTPGHLFPPREERKRAVFYQGLMEVYKINSQSPSGSLFSHAEKIRNDLKERPSPV